MLKKSSVSDVGFYAVCMDSDVTWGEWLEDRYTAKELSQWEFAEAIGVASSTVSGWVNYSTKPRRRSVPAIARVLEVDESEVLERSGLRPRRTFTIDEQRAIYIANPDTSIDLADEFVAFSAANYGNLTKEQKRLLIEMAREFMRSMGDRESPE